MWQILVPESRCGSAPRSPRADSDVVLLVDILQKLDIDSLVSPLGISEVAKILSQKQVIKILLYNITTLSVIDNIVCIYILYITAYTTVFLLYAMMQLGL